MIQSKLQTLYLKKARIFANIEMLSQVNDQAYLELGKVQADIMRLEKQLLREAKNPLDEN